MFLSEEKWQNDPGGVVTITLKCLLISSFAKINTLFNQDRKLRLRRAVPSPTNTKKQKLQTKKIDETWSSILPQKVLSDALKFSRIH